MADEFYRPKEWDSYIGQTNLKNHLNIAIQSAIHRQSVLDHVLLMGPPGCGKTTLSEIIANKMYAEFLSFVMPIKPNLLQQLVSSFQGVVLFDEIHRMSPKQQEELLPLIEDNYLQLSNGGRIYNENLTIIGATTERDKIIKPLWDRFVIKPKFDDYTPEDLTEIILGMAQASIPRVMDREDAMILAQASGGVPRVARTFVAMTRDLCASTGWLHMPSADAVLEACRVTREGLHEDHIDYLKVLRNNGGSSGLDQIANHLNYPKGVVIDLEKLLIRLDMITFTKSGRELKPAAYSFLSKGNY